MKHPPLTVHMVVKNEDRFIWYAIASVLDYADRILITDTGSTDRTIPIIESFRDDRIVLEKRQIARAEEIGAIRQEQIEKTKTDWVWIVDGDEVYSAALCTEITGIITRHPDLEGVVVGRYDLLGDIYHAQSETVGTYHLFGRKGHIVLRLINKKQLPGVHISGIYPYEGYYDQHGVEVIHHDPKQFAFTAGRMWHAMYLQRSSSGAQLSDTFHRRKWKIERGTPLAAHLLPDVFTAPAPAGIPDVRQPRSRQYELMAALLTPMKQIKRRILPTA